MYYDTLYYQIISYRELHYHYERETKPMLAPFLASYVYYVLSHVSNDGERVSHPSQGALV